MTRATAMCMRTTLVTLTLAAATTTLAAASATAAEQPKANHLALHTAPTVNDIMRPNDEHANHCS
ncbi:hypothetical protein ACIHFE_12610 [Streptomyces sp. NPDC052396]|uniref:hypothetical protein n=1 Tax=Streptomyces sp. NPDC052396 TaxID=3365689 RepID=UPI0037D65FEE